MDERQILMSVAMEIARLRYQAYVLYEENQRLSLEIEFRIKAVSDLINARLAEFPRVARHRRRNVKVAVENIFSTLRKRPKVDCMALRILRANAISLNDSRNFIPFYRH